MAEDFKPGDVVELKSGGPPMTIERQAPSAGEGWACTWFDGAKKEGAIFRADALKKHESPGGPRNISFGR
jgi:uncharacterized protein YodC (DUF2158 family)